MTLACEDANSKLVEVVTVADVDSEDHVGNSLLQTWPKLAYGRQGLDWIVGPGYSLDIDIDIDIYFRIVFNYVVNIFYHFTENDPRAIIGKPVFMIDL